MGLLQYSNSMKNYKLKKKRNKMIFIEWLILILFVTIFGGYLYENIRFSKIQTNNKQSGRVSSVENSKIYYNVSGQGEYTVILESNSGYGSIEWSNMVKNPPKNMKFLYYDRAGYGRSENIETERTPENLAKELHEVISKSQYKPPYIFVGNNYGTEIVKEYNKLYGEEVAGMILMNPFIDKEEGTSIKNMASLNLQKFTGTIGSTRVLQSFNAIKIDENILDSLSKNNRELYINYRVSSRYPSMKINEMKGIKNIDLDNQWIYDIDKPSVIYSDGNDVDTNKIGENVNLEVITGDYKGTVAALKEYEALIKALDSIIAKLPQKK